jgi:DNA-binding transcriptional LysR family regulator
LLPLAEDAQRLWQRIETEVSVDQTLRGTFRIGVTELIAMTWLTRFIKRLQKLHPKLVLEPVVDAGLHAVPEPGVNKIDLAIMPGTFWGQAVHHGQGGAGRGGLDGQPQPQDARRALKPQEFADYPVLEQSTGAAKNKFYEAWMAEHGFASTRSLPPTAPRCCAN